MIPEFNHSFVLPPYAGDRSPTSATMSPYVVSMSDAVRRFATTCQRIEIFRGLLAYRGELTRIGFVNGFQWLDGSFVENVESREARSPNDIDVVTFAHAPAGLTTDETRALLTQHPEIFVRETCKARFRCDTFLINLDGRPERLVSDTRYWFGMFSHRRTDRLWKGMLQVPLDSDDAVALELLPGDDDVEKTGA